jgi:hypothetical protein
MLGPLRQKRKLASSLLRLMALWTSKDGLEMLMTLLDRSHFYH